MAWNDAGRINVSGQSSDSLDPWGIGTFGSTVVQQNDIAFLILATDNIATTDVESTNHVAVTDSEGDVWAKIAEFTNGRGAANAGATVSCWWTKVVGTGATPISNLTVDFTAAITKKAYTIMAFTVAGGNTAEVAGYTTLATVGADPASLTLSGLPNDAYLFIRGIALESNTDANVTATTNWIALGGGASASTTGGGAAANMAVGGEYDMATGTSSGASNPTWASGDNANILFAMREVSGAPATSLLPPPFRQVSNIYNR